MKGNREESCKKVPMIFVASPSAKDSTWPERSPGTEKRRYKDLLFKSGVKWTNLSVLSLSVFDNRNAM